MPTYYIFSFLTFNLPESKKDSLELYKFWYHPSKAKEFIKEDSDNPWKFSNESISGKLWILKNCPLFKFYDIDITIIKDIKNADSHEKIIYRKDEILILLNDQTFKISENRVKGLTKYLIDCVFISIHFFFSVIIRRNFWTTPLLLISNSDRFKNKYVPFDILNDEKSETLPKEKGNNLSDSNSFEEIPVIFLMLIEFAIKELWDTLINDKENIDAFLKSEGMKLDLDLISNLKETSMLDLLNIISITTFKMKQLILKEDAEITENKIDNLEKIFDDFEQTSRRVLEKKNSDDIYLTLAFIFIIWGYGMLKPLKNLKDNLQKIIIKIE